MADLAKLAGQNLKEVDMSGSIKQRLLSNGTGYLIQLTYADIEIQVLQVLETIIGRKFGVGDLLGTREMRRLSGPWVNTPRIYRGRMNLPMVDLYASFQFCFRQGLYDHIDGSTEGESLIISSIGSGGSDCLDWVHYLWKRPNGPFMEIPYQGDYLATDLWGGKPPNISATVRSRWLALHGA